MITLVYDFNTATSRMGLWDQLRTLANNCLELWLLLGDFSAILSHGDRARGDPVTPHETVDFQNCVDDIGVRKVLRRGRQLSWCNKGDRMPGFILTLTSHLAILMVLGLQLHCGILFGTWMLRPFPYTNELNYHPY